MEKYNRVSIVGETSSIPKMAYRRSGKTTRFIDNAIQVLFGGGNVILLEDELPPPNYERNEMSKTKSKELFSRIEKRMINEHSAYNKAYKMIFDKSADGVYYCFLSDVSNQ